MKTLKIIFSFALFILSNNMIMSQSYFRDYFLGDYECMLTQSHNGDTAQFFDIVHLTASSVDTNVFIANDDIGQLNNVKFSLNLDSSFFDSTSGGLRYGNFYNNDSIYIIKVEPSGMGPFIFKFFGKKNNPSVQINDFSDNSFKIFPNPVNQNLQIISKLQIGDIQFQLIDLNGIKVFDKSFHIQSPNESISIDVSTIHKGLYILGIKTSKISTNKKILIE